MSRDRFLLVYYKSSSDLSVTVRALRSHEERHIFTIVIRICDSVMDLSVAGILASDFSAPVLTSGSGPWRYVPRGRGRCNPSYPLGTLTVNLLEANLWHSD